MQSIRRAEAGLHAEQPERVEDALRDRRTGRLAPKNGTLRSLKNCERSVRTPARMSSNTFSGRPPGLAGVFSISGVIAPIRTAFATRVVPCRPM